MQSFQREANEHMQCYLIKIAMKEQNEEKKKLLMLCEAAASCSTGSPSKKKQPSITNEKLEDERQQLPWRWSAYIRPY